MWLANICPIFKNRYHMKQQEGVRIVEWVGMSAREKVIGVESGMFLLSLCSLDLWTLFS